MKKRIDYLDIAKGIAMLCIIAGHLGVNAVNQFVFTFHVPIFFLISGYFLSDRMPVKEFAKDKAKRLMIPYAIAWGFIAGGAIIFAVLWFKTVEGVLYTLLNQVLSGLYGNGSSTHFIYVNDNIYLPTVGAIWFFPALFFAMVIVRYFMNRKYGGAWIFLIALLGYESSKAVWLPMSIQSGMVAASFVYIGMLARKYNVMEKKLPGEIKIGVAALWLFCVLFCGKLYLVENMFTNGIVDYAGALAGSYLVICFSRWLEKRTCFVKKVLCFWGQNTLIILCIHAVEMKIMPWNMLLDGFIPDGMPKSILHFPVKIFFCTLLTFAIVQGKCLVGKEKRKSGNI